jgi:hypothetical protein
VAHQRLDVDFFFHGADVIGEGVAKGDAVHFWLADSPNPQRGLVAVEVRKIPRARPAPGLTARLRPRSPKGSPPE